MSITIGADGKEFPDPERPGWMTERGYATYLRGFWSYVWHHRTGRLEDADEAGLSRRRYKGRHARQLFLQGWDAAKKLDT